MVQYGFILRQDKGVWFRIISNPHPKQPIKITKSYPNLSFELSVRIIMRSCFHKDFHDNKATVGTDQATPCVAKDTLGHNCLMIWLPGGVVTDDVS